METDCTVHKLIADMAVFARDRVLLVKYKDVSRYDGQRGWFLPDDFIHYAEHPGDAAKRIAKEQGGLDIPEVRLSHIESFGNGAWHLTFHYRADVKRAVRISTTKTLAAAEWFELANLPELSDVAHHGWALDVLRTMTGPRTS